MPTPSTQYCTWPVCVSQDLSSHLSWKKAEGSQPKFSLYQVSSLKSVHAWSIQNWTKLIKRAEEEEEEEQQEEQEYKNEQNIFEIFPGYLAVVNDSYIFKIF